MKSTVLWMSVPLLAIVVIYGCAQLEEGGESPTSEDTREIGYFVGEDVIYIPEGYNVPSGEYVISYDDVSVDNAGRLMSRGTGLDPAQHGIIVRCTSDCDSFGPEECPEGQYCQKWCYYGDDIHKQQFPVPVGGGTCEEVTEIIDAMGVPGMEDYIRQCRCVGG